MGAVGKVFVTRKDLEKRYSTTCSMCGIMFFGRFCPNCNHVYPEEYVGKNSLNIDSDLEERKAGEV